MAGNGGRSEVPEGHRWLELLPLDNPYWLPERSKGSRGAAAVAVVAGTAGLVVFGSGMASAEEPDDVGVAPGPDVVFDDPSGSGGGGSELFGGDLPGVTSGLHDGTTVGAGEERDTGTGDPTTARLDLLQPPGRLPSVPVDAGQPVAGVVAQGAPVPWSGSYAGGAVPWWSDPNRAGVRADGTTLPPTLLFPDVRPLAPLSSAEVNSTVLEQLDGPSGRRLEYYMAGRNEELRAHRVALLDRMADRAQSIFQAPGVRDQLVNVFTQLRTRADGGTPDFGSASAEAIEAATRLLELSRERAYRPDPGAVRAFAEALRDLGVSTGELTPAQAAELAQPLDRSRTLEARALEIARRNLATSRLRSSSDPYVDEAVRFLRTVCGDTATANAMCAPLDEGIVARGLLTDGLTGIVPPGVLPAQVQELVGNWRRSVRDVIDGSASPRTVLGLELAIQEVNTVLTAALPEDVPNDLPRGAERRALLGAATDARVAAIRAAREDPGSSSATTAYATYLGAVSTLMDAMGVDRTASDVVVPGPRGDEVPRSGAPTWPLILSEEEAGKAVAPSLLSPHVSIPRIVDNLTARALNVSPQPIDEVPAASGVAVGQQDGGAVAQDGGAVAQDGGTPQDAQESSAGSGGGVVVAPELPRSTDPWGDLVVERLRPDPPVELPDSTTTDVPRVDPREFDPNRGPGAAPTEQVALDVRMFPGRDTGLGHLLAPDGTPGLFTSPLGQEEVLAPTGGSGADERADPGQPSTARQPAGGGPSPGSAQPGATRVGSDGRLQQHLGGQDLVGDGRPDTTPGRFDFFRSVDGTTTDAVVQSPRRDNGDGTTTVWIPDLGRSVAYNPAGRTTSVQRVAAAGLTPATSVRAVTVRTGERVEALAGAGPGSVPGSVTYRPVPGNPGQQDVVVVPSVTEVVHPDGGVSRTYSAVVPANRQWNPSGARERFRVAVGTPVRPVEGTVFVPAPAPVPEATPTAPVERVPSRTTAPARRTVGNPATGQAPARSAVGNAATVPAPARRAVVNPAPAQRQAPTAAAGRVDRDHGAFRGPSPAVAVEPGPNLLEQAGQAVVDVLTYPHPLDPVRGPLRGIWPYLIPGAGGAGERQWSN